MSLFFLFSNLHFSLNIFGALVFFIAAWLAVDSFSIRRDLSAISKIIGFSLLAVAQASHAFDLKLDYYYITYFLYFLGSIFILISVAKEAFLPRPSLSAIIVLPTFKAVGWILSIVQAVSFITIGGLAFSQYFRENKKIVLPFSLSFMLLGLAAALQLMYSPDSLIEAYNPFWIASHILEFVGFIFLGQWVWSYLSLRLKEEILLILMSVTLLMGIVISLTFATILVKEVQDSTEKNLTNNARVLELTIDNLKEESRLKAASLAQREDIRSAIINNDFTSLEQLGTKLLKDEDLGFLTFLNANGDVITRAHALSRKEDNLKSEIAVKKALEGTPAVLIESSPVEKISIRASHPIISEGNLIGIILAGFQLDNAFADSMKKISDLDLSVYDNKTRVASTILDLDGKTRSINIEEVNQKVIESIFDHQSSITLSTVILSRPYLASYIPLTNDDTVVGMISTVKAQNEILDTTTRTNRLTLVTVMIIMGILILPLYFVTKRLAAEVNV